MDFGKALDMVKDGYPIFREEWNGSGLCVRLQRPDMNSKMTLPYLYMEYPKNAKKYRGAKCPWLASQTDILADDWDAARYDKNGLNINVGDIVSTTKGCRIAKKLHVGPVVGFSMWREYVVVKVRDDNGKTHTCLAKNIEAIARARK